MVSALLKRCKKKMKKLKDEIVQFFQEQGCVIVSTIDKDGGLHSSCKGILKINQNGRAYLLDLYKGVTFDNLKRNPHMSITSVDEHRFKGYCLKGKARLVKRDAFMSKLVKIWEDRITSRVTRRIIKNIQGEKGHARHPEVLLPKPEYMIVMDVEDIIDLTPFPLKERE